MEQMNGEVLLVVLLTLTTFAPHIEAEFPRKEKSRSVWIEQGLVRGNIFSIGNRHVQIFRGIPYAEPPLGNLRFAKSVKKSRWHYEHFANDYGAACLQFSDYYLNDRYSKSSMGNQSEDCLFLNVFSPYDPEDEGRLYPILVWIHGGSFMAGSGDTGIDMEVTVENIVFKNVSLVTFNYRLGPLGFMSYENGDFIDGNFGIWDQVTVLEWIQANMKQLNGDPSNVTVMGEDAGAAAASLLAISSRTDRLLHRAITWSGSITSGWAIQRHRTPNWELKNLVQYLKCEKMFDKSNLEKLGLAEATKNKSCNLQEKTVDCLNVCKNYSNYNFILALTDLGAAKMVVDGDLIPGSSKNVVRQNARIPLLLGVANTEWGCKKPENYGFKRFQNVSDAERRHKVWQVVEEHYHSASENLLSNSTLDLISTLAYMRYFGSGKEYLPTNIVVAKLQKMQSDIDFIAAAQKEIEAYMSNEVPVYAFSFDYMSKTPVYETVSKSFSLFGNKTLSVSRTLRPLAGSDMQAFHGMSHAYIFTKGYKTNFYVSEFSAQDQNMTNLLTKAITNFVKYGLQQRSLHWPDTIFWNIEADLIEQFSSREQEFPKEVDELSSEERIQLAAYRRAWWALWILVALIGLIIWVCIIFIVVKKCRSPRAKPYDNIVFNR
uniref:COesterase domain-containing protein n=1 Tax=Syphacia muris TaxID=451379 RepID=A0A0N5AKE3_9BILA